MSEYSSRTCRRAVTGLIIPVFNLYAKNAAVRPVSKTQSPMSNHDIPVVVLFTRLLPAALFKLTPSFRV